MTASSMAHKLTQPANEHTCSERRLEANRQKAQLSTGPNTEQGQATSSLNAVDEAAPLSEPKIQAVTALTGRTVLLPADDAAEYQHHAAAYVDTYKPVGLRECELVQSLSDTMWRLHRITGLEMALYARGNMEFAGAFEEHPAALRPGMIELQTFLKYEKQLRNLQIQEARLQRRYQKEAAELRNLQKERAHKQEVEEQLAASARKPAASVPKPPSPASAANGANGFEFATAPATPALSPGSDLSYLSSASELQLK